MELALQQASSLEMGSVEGLHDRDASGAVRAGWGWGDGVGLEGAAPRAPALFVCRRP